MRKRSLSVACERALKQEQISNKFEGVPSEHEQDSETEEENDEVPHESDWTGSDYKMLMNQLRSILPRKDSRKYQSTLNKIDWDLVAFEGHSPEEVKAVTHRLMGKIRKYRTLSEMIEDIPLHAAKDCSIRKPKNPLNANNFFVKDRFPYIKNKNPDLPTKDIFKMVHQEFNTLSEKKKKKYEAMAAEAKEVYQRQMELYYRENPQALKKTKRGDKSKTSKASKPKTITPFSLFQEDKRKESQGITFPELRVQWNQLEVKKKMKYIQLAFQSQAEDAEKLLKLTKEEQCLMEHAKGRPVPIPHSTKEYYLKNYADQPLNSSMSMSEWRKQKFLEFNNLPKVRKLELEIEYRQAKQDFVSEYENYIESITDEAKQQAEIGLLKAFIEKKMDKDDRQQLPDESRQYSSKLQTSQLENEMQELPIAESTVLKTKKKKVKNSSQVQDSTNTSISKPLKSILKSPAKKDAEMFAEPAVPKNKRKLSLNDDDSDSNSEKRSKHSIVHVPIVEPDMKKTSSKANGTTSTAADTIPEPERPPKTILEYYMQKHYLGKAEHCAESFKKLSTKRKETLRVELRTWQRKYFKQLQKYLKSVSPKDIKSYVRKLKEVRDEFNIGSDSLNESGSVEEERVPETTPKKEPQTSSSNSSGSDDESSKEDKSKNGQTSRTVEEDSSSDEE